jgi:hypothetical protein
VVEGIIDSYDISVYATASAGGGTVGSYALNPTVTGFDISSSSGLIDFDGTLPAGNVWLTCEAADTNGTTQAPDLIVTVVTNPLGLVDVSVDSIATHTATITSQANAALGTVYVSVTLAAADCDTAAEIISGNGDTAVWYENRDTELILSHYVTGLSPDTQYYYGVVQSYSGENSDIITGSFSTQAEITYTDEGKAPVTRP